MNLQTDLKHCTIFIDSEDKPALEALDLMADDEWTEDNYCCQTVLDLRILCMELLLRIAELEIAAMSDEEIEDELRNNGIDVDGTVERCHAIYQPEPEEREDSL